MSDRRRIVIGTRNKKKLVEIERLLDGLPVDLSLVEEYPLVKDVEETETTFAGNAALKATEVAAATGEWVVADDSGLEVDALDGRPGIFSARYAGPDQDDRRNIAKVLSEMKDVPPPQRTARFLCAIALAAPDKLLFVVEEVCEGVLTAEPRGESGFGYDPIFVPEGHDRTFAELGAEIKDRLSHRGKALHRFREELEKLL